MDDEFTCSRSKVYSFKGKNDDENKNKLKGVSKSQSKHIKFEEVKICLDGEENITECDTYNLRSVNQEMYLQKLRKTSSSFFDDKSVI